MFSNTVNRFRDVMVAAALVATAAVAGAADGPDVQERNPYTILGHQVRTNLIPHTEVTRATSSLGPTLFQEIVPCRFISTLEADHYPALWGGPEFEMNEARTYMPKGVLIHGNFTNPCSDKVPYNAVAVSVRLATNLPKGDGVLWLAPGTMSPFDGEAAIQFKSAINAWQEANVVLLNERFVLASEKARTHVTADIIGYFITDEYRGAKGERGEQGPQGPRGEQGLRGERGAQGLKGENGERGPQGEAGPQGTQGVQGLKGENGERGPQGEAGPQGAQGLQGLKGENGERGPQGEAGPQGAQGLQGLKGENGERGPQGEAGPQGAQGLQGLKGDTGERGLQGERGLKGDKGDKGATGEAGPMGPKGDTGLDGAQGPMGPAGPMGPQGEQGPAGTCNVQIFTGSGMFEPNGTVRVNDARIHSDTIIIIQYIEVSNGNTAAVVDQGEGWVILSGSPNKPYGYVAINR